MSIDLTKIVKSKYWMLSWTVNGIDDTTIEHTLKGVPMLVRYVFQRERDNKAKSEHVHALIELSAPKDINVIKECLGPADLIFPAKQFGGALYSYCTKPTNCVSGPYYFEREEKN